MARPCSWWLAWSGWRWPRAPRAMWSPIAGGARDRKANEAVSEARHTPWAAKVSRPWEIVRQRLEEARP
ncbi:MAG: hypothetical protein GXY76_10500 [Chloroflexi bacterium]|nr:hypothetical protein [Chloroflexota bacterium]